MTENKGIEQCYTYSPYEGVWALETSRRNEQQKNTNDGGYQQQQQK